MGCAGEEIAKLAAATLNLELYDDDKLQQTAMPMGKELSNLKQFDEKAPSFFDRLISNKPDMFLELMEALIYEVAKKGEGIIIGHGGQFLLRDFGCALHVLVFGSHSSRVQHVVKQEGVSRETAERLIRRSDDNQSGFFDMLFTAIGTIYRFLIWLSAPTKCHRRRQLKLLAVQRRIRK